MKYWRGEYVTVFPNNQWKFHTCLLCGKTLKGNTPAAKTGFGPECASKHSKADLDAIVANRLDWDRDRYRKEVLRFGFKIENPQ